MWRDQLDTLPEKNIKGIFVSLFMTMEMVEKELQEIMGGMASSEHSPRFLAEGLTMTYALRSARTVEDIAVISLGTTIPDSDLLAARMALTVMRFDPGIRSLGIIRYSPDIIDICRALLLDICSFDRLREPPGGRSIDWGVAFCCEREEGVPDIIYDTGKADDRGLIRFFGLNPTVVSGSINRILTRICNTNFSEE